MEAGFGEGSNDGLRVSLMILEAILEDTSVDVEGPRENVRNLVPFVMLGLGMVQEAYDFLKSTAFDRGVVGFKNEDMFEDILECSEHRVCFLIFTF